MQVLKMITYSALSQVKSLYFSHYLQQKTGWVVVLIPPVVARQLWLSKHHKFGCNLMQPDSLSRYIWAIWTKHWWIELENEAAPQIGRTAFQKSLCRRAAWEKAQWKCIINILLSCHPTNAPAPARIKKKTFIYMVGSNYAQSRVVGSATVHNSIAVYVHLGRKAQRVSYCTNGCSLLSECGLVMVGVSHRYAP